MNDKQDDKLDAFDDFEELPPLENTPHPPGMGDLGDGSGATQEEQRYAELTAASLGIAWAVMNGDLNILINMPSGEKQIILDFLNQVVGNPGGNYPEGHPSANQTVGPEGPTPSEEAAAKVVQTPEEKKREQEFLDILGQ